MVSGRSVKASLGRSVVGHSGGLGTEVEKWCPHVWCPDGVCQVLTCACGVIVLHVLEEE